MRALPDSAATAGRAVVIGAGVGGLCAAARLAHAGWEVEIVERLRHVGGRWSTRVVDGFKLPTGAFLIAIDDPLGDTFADLGLEFPVRPIEERTVYMVHGELVGTGERGGLRSLIGSAARLDDSDGDRVVAALRGALAGVDPVSDEPLPAWLQERGAGPVVVAAVHSLTQAFMGLNAAEVTASAFVGYLSTAAGRGRHGIPPQGSIRLAEILADYVRSHGGQVRLGSGARAIHVEDGRAAAVEARDGTTVEADLVISDIGLEATAALLPAEHAGAIPSPSPEKNAPGITAFVASREPFYDHPAVVVSGTRCVCLVSTPTLVAPELAPEGWHFTETISTFSSSLDDSDPKGEMRRHMDDVDDLLPGWRDKGRLLQTATYRGTWPIYRSWPGYDPQERFPMPGLALVGDAVKPPGWPGTGASAEGARLVVEAVTTRAAPVRA